MNGRINPLGLISSRRVLPIAFISLLFFASCASMQDDRLVSAGDSATTDRLASVEEAVVRIDSLSGAERSEAIAAAREKIDALYLLNVENTVFQSRLHAWSGRLFLAAGKRSEAAKRYDAAVRLLPSDIPSSILGARLEKTGEAGLARIDGALSVDPGEPRLLAERALYAERLGRYSNPSPPSTRRSASFLRTGKPTINQDRSWELRASGTDSLSARTSPASLPPRRRPGRTRLSIYARNHRAFGLRYRREVCGRLQTVPETGRLGNHTPPGGRAGSCSGG